MKYFYYVIDIKENGKYYTHAARISENTNIHNNALFNQPGIISITPCSTKKQAQTIVNHRNAAYKVNGNYMFQDEPLF